MMRAIVCLMGRSPGGLMESSQERIISLMEAVVGSMGAMVGSMGDVTNLMGAVVGSMGDVGSMIGPLMAAEKQSSVGRSTASRTLER